MSDFLDFDALVKEQPKMTNPHRESYNQISYME